MTKRAYEAKHLRGTIIETLGDYYPNGLSGRSIFSTIVLPVFPDAEWNDVLQQLSYLRQRDFIEDVGACGIGPANSPQGRISRLTAAGYDVAKGITEDPAIMVEG